MLNKKTVAIKQEGILKAGLKAKIDGMTPDELAKLELAMEQILLNRGLRGILSQIGMVHEIPFSDGRKTLSVVLTYEGVRSLGINLDTVFRGCGGKEVFDERTDVKNGVLVNLDLYQQVTILRAIILKKPELQDVLGLYNLRGSRKVYEVLSREGIPRQLDIWWMRTADRYVPNQSEANYPEEGIVGLSSLGTLKGYRFASRDIVNDGWGVCSPDDHYDSGSGVAVFGAQR